MKKFFSYFAVSMTMILGLAVSSCSTDNCKNVDCGTNGTCDAADGKCLCNAGYELGTTSKKCDVASRDKFLGTWNGLDCGATVQHPIVITAGSEITKVSISRYANAFCGSATTPLVATAKLSSDGSKLETFVGSCDTQTVINASGNSMSLSSDGKTLTNVYSVVDKGGSSTGTDTTYNCTLTYMK